jgi:hypothetical protein
MDIEKGMLVKTLSGTIVKTDNQISPGYWYCEDSLIHLGVSLSEVSEDERKLYFVSHNRKETAVE